ncbi:MAG: response regulator [Chloroflexi bacterium]|nr:response regulator [Chloroflexota bacterium]
MFIKQIAVLLVEDDPGDARLISEMLGDGGDSRFLLTSCETLARAMDRARNEQFDVILLDLSLPDSYGLDTVMKMRSEAQDVAIVVLTGWTDQTFVGVEAVQAGAQDYLIKGDVDSKLLRRSIRYAIERNRIEMQLRRSQQEYRSLIDDVFDTSMVAVIILDKEFKVVWCNEAVEIYFGFQREDVVGRDKRILIDDELKCIFADPDDFAARLLEAYEQRVHTDRFECHVLPDGDREERWLEHWSQPIRDGMYAGGRIEQYTDITDRKMLEIAEAEERQFAEALSDIATVLTSSLDQQEVLQRILANLYRVVPHDSASITIIDEGNFDVIQFDEGNKHNTKELVAQRHLQLDYGYYTDIMYDNRQPVLVADLQENTQMESIAEVANVRGYVGVPIQLQESIIGFLNLFSQKPDFFSEHHVHRLSAFGELAAIAIQNAKLYHKSQNLAALEERQRLARELHDSVTQTIFTCRTMAETALRRWKKDPERARELLETVYELTITALSEMRILLLELRPASLTQIGLKQLFEQYLKPIQGRRQFKLVMKIDDIPPLSPDVQIALYRITQEALNNIEKHAQATHVSVKAQAHEDGIILEIVDNGSGFDEAEVQNASLGLGIMRERAENIGASISIQSKPGKGTRILVAVAADASEDRDDTN